MMNKNEFQKLVTQLERESEAAPRRYRLKVVLFASVGYAYIALIALLAVSCLIWALSHLANADVFGALQVGLLAGLIALLLLPALWVRIPEPQGWILNEAQNPKLFALIEKLRNKSGCPKIDQVILTDAFNTAIVQIPRLGILGWHRNILIIGLPMLQALSRKEFAAILAHEFAHLSRSHGQLGTWIYRIRTVWMRVYNAFGAGNSFGSPLLTRFLRWYIPWFNAYSFVLARQDEYEADRIAAAIVGPRTLADALIAIAVRGRFLEEHYWPDLWSRADRNLNPPILPHASMRTALHLGLDETESERLLGEQLKSNTACDDTHPCLRDRILALATPCELPPDAAHSAAQSLLGDQLGELQRAMDGLWQQHNGARWRERYHTVQSAHEIVQRLSSPERGRLAPDELTHFGQALNTLGRRDEALSALRQAADHPNGSADAAMTAARLLLVRDDEACLRYLALAAHRNPALSEETRAQAAAFHARKLEQESNAHAARGLGNETASAML